MVLAGISKANIKRICFFKEF